MEEFMPLGREVIQHIVEPAKLEGKVGEKSQGTPLKY